MSLATHTLTHVIDGQSNLLGFLRAKPNYMALAAVYLAEVQDLEDALWTLATQRALSQNPVGAQLDGIGQIIGVARNGLGDTDYLSAINTQIAVNTSSGLINDLLRIVASFNGGTNTAKLIPSWPAQFILVVGNGLANPAALLSVIGTAKAGGVGGYVIYQAPSTTNSQILKFDTAGVGLDQGLLTAGAYS